MHSISKVEFAAHAMSHISQLTAEMLEASDDDDDNPLLTLDDDEKRVGGE